eukprot:TRINITY_DN30251_c0_g1_i1.p1 TRINITY_DN30251_c0_g1~~TRINITY_DN30251_c0_g1_i1.p1  ORF type:complete len:618 (+),score=58.33 TRINITY_DN30251_c0_g1_i1:57-1910(+)
MASVRWRRLQLLCSCLLSGSLQSGVAVIEAPSGTCRKQLSGDDDAPTLSDLRLGDIPLVETSLLQGRVKVDEPTRVQGLAHDSHPHLQLLTPKSSAWQVAQAYALATVRSKMLLGIPNATQSASLLVGVTPAQVDSVVNEKPKIFVVGFAMLCTLIVLIFLSFPLNRMYSSTNREGASMLQGLLLLIVMYTFVKLTAEIPLSLDVTYALDHGAVASGFLVSVSFFSMAFGIVIARHTMGRCPWNQRQSRRNFMLAYVADIAVHLGSAFVLSSSADVRTKFNMLFTCRMFTGILVGFLLMSAMLMLDVVVPPSGRNSLGMLMQVSKNIGGMVGPGICCVVLTMLEQHMPSAGAVSKSAWLSITLAGISAGFVVFVSIIMPLDIPQKFEPQPTVNDRMLDPAPEKLPDAARAEIVRLGVIYTAERSFTMAAVEVATLMILEVQYGWDVISCVLAVTGAAILSSLGCMVQLVLLHVKFVRESYVMCFSVVCGVLGTLLLFEVPSFREYGIIFADAIICTSISVSSGICDGWATRAVKAGTAFSNDVFRFRSGTLITLTRLLTPPTARFLVDIGGRNLYATIQVIIALSGCITGLKMVCILWDRRNAPSNALPSLLSKPTG